MLSEPNNIQPNRRPRRQLDELDLKILGELTANGRATYAEIGERVALSAPAVHERVKRLVDQGAISGIVARLNGPAVGKSLLSFVHVDADGWGKSQRMMRLRSFPEVEEMHSVAGDTSVIMKVRTENAHALEQFLHQLYALPGVRSTKSYVVLSTFEERGVQARTTQDWPEVALPED